MIQTYFYLNTLIRLSPVVLVLLANVWSGYILIAQWLMGMYKLMLLYHGVLEKGSSSCDPASSIFVTAVFWRLSFFLAWRDPRMKGVTAGLAYWDSVYAAGLCCWITSIYWLYLTNWCSCFTFLNAKMLLVNLMQDVSLLLVPEMWWKTHPQHEKLENQGGSDNRPGTSQGSFWERLVLCTHEGKKPRANELA